MGAVKVGVKDLEEIMDQQAWLNTCDRVRKNHKLTDAYEHTTSSPFLPNSLPPFGETDCAFRINDVVGVQMSHQDNVWAPSFNPRDDLAERVYDDQGHDYGTYISFQPENLVEEVIGQTPWKVTVDRSKKYDNRAGAVDFTYRTSHAKSETVVKEVTVTNSVSVTMEAGFEAFGADVKISSTYEHSKAEMDSNTTTKGEEEEVTVTVPAGKYFELHVAKKECTKRYRIRVPVVMEGWVGLATRDRNTWDRVLPLTDPNDLDGSKGQSFLSKKQATRWLNLQMNVESTEIEAISHGAPTAAAVTEAKVLEELKPAPINVKPAPTAPTEEEKKAHEKEVADRLKRRNRHD